MFGDKPAECKLYFEGYRELARATPNRRCKETHQEVRGSWRGTEDRRPVRTSGRPQAARGRRKEAPCRKRAPSPPPPHLFCIFLSGGTQLSTGVTQRICKTSAPLRGQASRRARTRSGNCCCANLCLKGRRGEAGPPVTLEEALFVPSKKPASANPTWASISASSFQKWPGGSLRNRRALLREELRTSSTMGTMSLILPPTVRERRLLRRQPRPRPWTASRSYRLGR